MTIPIVSVVHIYIWCEDDFFGSTHVMLQHEGCEPFCYASFHYNYQYTSNVGTFDEAEKLARSLGAKKPIEWRHRGVTE